MLAEERKKGKDGMTAPQVATAVKQDYEWAPCAKTIRHYVDAGRIGTSPLKRGEVGKIPSFVYKTLCSAFESMIRKN